MKQRTTRLAAWLLTGALAVTCIPFPGTSDAVYAAAGAEAAASITAGKVTVGNNCIVREFSISGGKIHTAALDNKRADLKFAPADGSEEFIIRVKDADEGLPGEINRSGWTAKASDQYNVNPGDSDGPAENTIDGEESTIWHSDYHQSVTGYPHHLIFDMQKDETIRAFSYLPRQDSDNGQMGDYLLYVGDSEEGLESEENLAAQGDYTYNGRERMYVNLPEAKTGRYVMLKSTKPHINGQAWATAAEINFYSEPIDLGGDKEDENLMKASDLTLDTGAVRSVDTESGIVVEFPFETYQKNGVNWDITMKIAMDDGDHYMRKFLEIQADDPDKAVIDYIDLESMNVNESDAVWTHPAMGAGVGGMSGYVISLGQPVYIQGMFFGCEFPMTETEIDADANAHMRYFSGKSFRRLGEDNQMTLDGKYVTWQTVAGAARSTDMNVIQSDFYEYINSIATKTDFRTQYNSWYDNMMTINDQNIASAFTRMEKGLSESGVIPMDSYVVDDGWNNYNSSKYGVHDVARCGTTDNETGFWEFNNKFPKGLDPSCGLTESFGSGFGVWLGPRGGYNYNNAMGHIIEDAGNGAFNAQSGDIDVGDRRYINRLTEFFLQLQDAHKINYWKLDGFATQACSNKKHHHMTGGKNGMYYFTDTWEGWIDLIETLRANADKNGIKNLWFNLTCYVNPSPWYLQWANSIWLQVSNDIGRANVGQTRQVDQLLSYRDGTYFDFVKNREFQFPLENVYNHDPIYGKTDTGLAGTMTDAEFQAYLYMMATRGTAFWELYYSPEMIDEGQKWAVNAEFLEWARENHHILKHAKLLGATPTGRNTYGYSCWDGEEGIISMRNPSDQEKTLTYTLDRNIGAAESLEGKTLIRTTVLSFRTTDSQESYKTLSYGDEISVTLQPGEARIWKLSTKADTAPANIIQTKTDGERTIVVRFDERIQPNGVSAAITGNSAENVEYTADGKAVRITLGTALTDKQSASVTLSGVKDLSGNAKEYTFTVPYYAGDLIAKASAAADLKGAAGVTEETDPDLKKNTMRLDNAYQMASAESMTGNCDFGVSSYINTTASDAAVIAQGDEYSLSINAAGNLVFTVGSVSVVSKEAVNDGKWKHIAGLREKNGVIKVYINGALANSKYDISDGIRDVQAGNITVGAAGKAMQVSEVEVKNSTYALNGLEAKAEALGDSGGGSGIVPDENGKIPLAAERISVKNAKTHEDVVNTGGSGVSNMIDGGKSSGSFTCTTDDFEAEVTANPGTSAYFEIDLGDQFLLDEIKMWRYYADGRTYKDTIIVASEDKTFDAADYVLYSAVSDEAYAYGLLTAEKLANPDELYAETADGKTFKANGQKVRYIRIYMRGSKTPTNSHHGGNHVCEVEVYGRSIGSGGEEPVETEHAITFHTLGGNDIPSIKVLKDAEWEFPEEPVRDGYVFDGWYTNVNCSQNSAYTQTAPVSRDLDLFAAWRKACTVSFFTNGGTEVASQTVVKGETATAPANPTRGEDKFLGWYQDVACTVEFDWSEPIENDCTIYAGWEKKDTPVDPDLIQLRAQLTNDIKAAKAIAKGDYTDASWEVFKDAISDAEKVDVNTATKEQLNAAIRKLADAKNGLKKNEPVTPEDPELTALKNQFTADIQGAKAVAKGDYTDESWNAFQAAIAAAEKIDVNTATKETLQAELKKLSDAKAALKIKEAPVAQEVPKGYTFKSSKFTFKVTDPVKKTVTVTKVTGLKGKSLKIADAVKLNNVKYKVTGIAASAFKGNKKITGVTIGKNVTSIGASAFANCQSLKKVTINSTKLKSIGSNAFKGCKALGTITIKSKSLTTVGKNAFKGINGKAKIKVPSSKLKAYKRLMNKKGQGKKVKITKS